MVKVFSPGTIGNVGPGFDVLGLAIAGLGDTITMEESDETRIEIHGRDANLLPTDPQENTVSIAAKALFDHFGKSIDLNIRIDRDLPCSGGLGASASSSVAGALGAAALIGNQDDRTAIIEAALVAEAYVAGRHLDNIAPCLYGGLTIVQSVDPARIHQVPMNCDLFAMLITPAIKIKTKDSRAVLPESLKQGDWIQQMANTATLVNGFSLGNSAMIASGLEDHYGEKFRSKLIPHFDQAKALALDSGALGYSISGAGPTCFALFESHEKATACQKQMESLYNGECSSHVGELSREGARII